MLLTAAEASDHHCDGGNRILPDKPTASQKVMAIRTRQKLWELGLVWKGFEEGRPIRVKRNATITEWHQGKLRKRKSLQSYEMTDGCYQVVRLSPFGAAVVARYRRELEGGKPLRWDGRVADALAEVRQGPAALLVTLARNIAEELSNQKHLPQVADQNPDEAYSFNHDIHALVLLLQAVRAVAPDAAQVAIDLLDAECRGHVALLAEKLTAGEGTEP
jgi:hypothetical protein